MEWKGKLIGGSLGMLGGPFGVGLGLLVGHLVDATVASSRFKSELAGFLSDPKSSALAARADGLIAYFVLGLNLLGCRGFPGAGAIEQLKTSAWGRFKPHSRDIAACDAVITELGAAERLLAFVSAEPGSGDTAARIAALAGALKARQAREARIDLLEDLYRLAALGRGSISEGLERPYLLLIAREWEITQDEVWALEQPFRENSPWTILGVRPDVDRDELKRVYRGLAAQFHPDGAAGLDEGQRRATEEAFRRIKDAYEECLRGFDP
jgi:DnaJ-domain-containing protein 1